MATVLQNLDDALLVLNPSYSSETNPISTSEKAKGFTELMAIRLKEITEKNPSDAANKVQMQEAQLIIEQLVWLINLSENILKNTKLLVEKE